MAFTVVYLSCLSNQVMCLLFVIYPPNGFHFSHLRRYIFFPLHRAACGILVPQPRIEPGPLAVKAQNPNHWTAREFPRRDFLKFGFIYRSYLFLCNQMSFFLSYSDLSIES